MRLASRGSMLPGWRMVMEGGKVVALVEGVCFRFVELKTKKQPLPGNSVGYDSRIVEGTLV